MSALPSPAPPGTPNAARRACVQEQLWGTTLAAQEGTVMMSWELPVILMKLKLHVTSDPAKKARGVAKVI